MTDFESEWQKKKKKKAKGYTLGHIDRDVTSPRNCELERIVAVAPVPQTEPCVESCVLTVSWCCCVWDVVGVVKCWGTFCGRPLSLMDGRQEDPCAWRTDVAASRDAWFLL